ncbi:hypothetical protein P0D72_12795 [Paraburkholderia sediminicola]|uniref:hypothetical protein n=1 Tax=Paraburkholderia sediminicola TaxID=458836 RepID=UPI0038B88842
MSMSTAVHLTGNRISVAGRRNSADHAAGNCSGSDSMTNQPANIPADSGGAYLPWGPYLSADDVRRNRPAIRYLQWQRLLLNEALVTTAVHNSAHERLNLRIRMPISKSRRQPDAKQSVSPPDSRADKAGTSTPASLPEPKAARTSTPWKRSWPGSRRIS